MNRKYWINTVGSVTLLFSGMEITPPADLVLKMKLKRCSELEYKLFEKLGINLKAPKGRKTSWAKARFMKWLTK
jgi:hypothetical protein